MSFLGDAMGLVALILYVAEEVGTGSAVAFLLLAGDFTPTLLSPLVGVIADRVERRRLLIICELGQAVAIGTIVVVEPPLLALLVLVAIQSLVANLFQATARSAVPDLVADEDLERANALIGGGTHGLEALGPLLAAVLLPFVSPQGVLGIDAVTFLVSPLIACGPPTDAQRCPLRPARVRLGGGSQRDAVHLAPTHPAQRVVESRPSSRWWRSTASTTWRSCSFGRDTFAAGDSGISLLYAASGIGLLLGFALAAAARATRSPAITVDDRWLRAPAEMQATCSTNSKLDSWWTIAGHCIMCDQPRSVLRRARNEVVQDALEFS